MKQRKIQAVESFIVNFEHVVNELEEYSDFLKLNDEAKEIREDALDILKKKIKKMKKATDEDDLKKVLRLKRLYEKSGMK